MKKKNNVRKGFRNTIVIVLLLSVAQALFLGYRWSSRDVVTVAESISNNVKKISDPVEKERHRLRMAMNMFMVRHQHIPQDVEQLVPEFLSEVPRNPKTGGEFAIVEKGMRFEVAPTIEDAHIIQGQMGGTIRGDNSEDLELLKAAVVKTSFFYNPTGKRDPFLAYGSEEAAPTNCPSPIECTALVKLKLALVIDTGQGKRAMVETPDGKGHTVQLGSKIGNANGEVVDIQADKVLVLEEHKDLAGNLREHTYELKLR
jgi:Tfp pilus assembly protein PilP